MEVDNATNASALNTTIQVNDLAHDPHKAWDNLKNKIKKVEIKPLELDTPIFDDKAS